MCRFIFTSSPVSPGCQETHFYNFKWLFHTVSLCQSSSSNTYYTVTLPSLPYMIYRKQRENYIHSPKICQKIKKNLRDIFPFKDHASSSQKHPISKIHLLSEPKQMGCDPGWVQCQITVITAVFPQLICKYLPKM